MQERDGLWEVIAFDRVLYIKQINRTSYVFHCSSQEYNDVWVDYFDLNSDYDKIKHKILAGNDLYLKKAVEYGYGLRILNQNLWEVIISFIISQRNNIPRIKKTIEQLCLPYGNSFPDIRELKTYSERDFKNIGAGYRAKYLMNACNIDLNYLKTLDYQKAIEYLKQFNGIGDKVANCIALFGLHKMEAFPRDVWINRIINTKYHGIFDVTPYKEHAGIIQQYMFFYERNSNNL